MSQVAVCPQVVSAGRAGAQVRAARVCGLGAYVPEQVLTNRDLEQMVDTSDEWIVSHTGISQRHIARDDQACSDLAAEAASMALARSGIPRDQIELILVATVTPDHSFPATACYVQDKLGLPQCACFDVGTGCTGFIYGLAIGGAFVAAGLHDYVLVMAAETLSKVTDWEDRSTCVLFGDGAGAAVLGPTEPGDGLLAYHMVTDGSVADLLQLPAGGSRQPITPDALQRREQYIRMAGHDVFKLAVRGIPEVALAALDKAGLVPEDVDLLVMHQANQRIIDAAAKRFDLPPEKVVCNVDRYGNTSAASIPIALAEAEEDGRLQRGSIVLMVGFGAGFSLGACVVRW
jgi:3-oxoacyl-[acyl-carrier-protein] synthase-3